VEWPVMDERAHAEKYEEVCLYDLENDPYELVNLIGCPPYREIADDLQARLRKLMADAEEPPFEVEAAEPQELLWRRPDLPKE
jgi:hypothetical protein